MKLRLPKGLRAALLAVVSIAVTSYSAYAAGPAAYDYMVVSHQTSHYFAGTTPPHGISLLVIDGFDMSQNWVMDVSVNSMNGAACTDNTAYSGGASIIGNVDIPYKSTQIQNGGVSRPEMEDHEYSIYFTPSGKIYSLSNTGKHLLGKDPNGIASLVTGVTPFQVTLNWVINDDNTGSLYYVGGSSVNINGTGAGAQITPPGS